MRLESQLARKHVLEAVGGARVVPPTGPKPTTYTGMETKGEDNPELFSRP